MQLLQRPKPNTVYLTNKEILEKMNRFRNMLTDNKNIDFGNIRNKYFNKYKINVPDLSRLQSILFIKRYR